MTIGFNYPSPPIGSARALQRQIQLEEQAEREAALATQQAADIERGRARREKLAELQANFDLLADAYEQRRKELVHLVEQLFDAADAITNMGVHDPIPIQWHKTHLPPLIGEQPMHTGFSTVEGQWHQRMAVRMKRARGGK